MKRFTARPVRVLLGVLSTAGLVMASIQGQPEAGPSTGAVFAQIDVTATPFPGAQATPALTPGGPIEVPPGLLPPGSVPGAFAPRPDLPLQCPPEGAPQAPVVAEPDATPFPVYQPPPWRTGEIVVVANTAGLGANFRVAPRSRARIWRVVPEGEALETVGADLVVDGVPWAYVRDQLGTVGWIAANQLTTVALLPGGREPLRPRGATFAACPTPTFTPTPGGAVITISLATPTPAR